MTESLNRKFDLLVKSGTCSPYLIDVVTLLVAHANDTELFKKELRSAPFHHVVPPVADQQVTSICTNKSKNAIVPQESKRVLLETEVEEVAVRAQETILHAAESSLRSYAADLKKINDIAIATSSKSLREIKISTSNDMQTFRDRIVINTVERTREELDSLRMDWLESINKDVERLKNEIHKVGLKAQEEFYKITQGYDNYISKGFELLKVDSLEDIHRVMGECTLAVQRLEVVEQQIVPRVEINVLFERLKSIERFLSQMTNNNTSNSTLLKSNIPFSSNQKILNSSNITSSDSEDITSLGLHIRDGGDEVKGIIIKTVIENSPAEKAQIFPNFIISQVGAIPVTRKEEFIREVEKSGKLVKLTVYDPKAAKIRVITLER